MYKRNLIHSRKADTYRSSLLPLIFIFLLVCAPISALAQNLVWAKCAGGSDGEGGHSIAALPDGSAIVTGVFSGTATFGPGETGETILSGYVDIFIAKYNPNGSLVWAKRAGGSGWADGLGIAVLPDGSVFVTGCFAGSATFGPGESGEITLPGTEPFNYDIFIARYNHDGTLAWAKCAGGTNDDGGYAIAVLSDGSVLLTGSFSDTATFGQGEGGEITLLSAGEGDIFIARYNADGTLVWAKRAGGTGSDYGSGIGVLSDGSVIVTGSFWYTATFGPGETRETVMDSAGYGNSFIARYNPDGTLAWAKHVAAGYYSVGRGIAVLTDGAAIVVGEFLGTVVFKRGVSEEITLNSAGGWDIFVANYNQNGSLAWAKQAGGSEDEILSAIAALPDGSALVTARFHGTSTFGPRESNETMLTSAGDADIVLARYYPDGKLAWATRAGGSARDGGFSVALPGDGSAMVTGYFEEAATFGPGESQQTILTSAGDLDIFVAKFTGAVPTSVHPYWSLYY
jgi:uncharacterized delta-60 repeat protein